MFQFRRLPVFAPSLIAYILSVLLLFSINAAPLKTLEMRPTLWLLALLWSICSTASQEDDAEPSEEPENQSCIMLPNGEREDADVPEGRAEWEKLGLDTHNRLRDKHHSPALVHNETLCKSAQWTANKNVAEWHSLGLMHTEEYAEGYLLSCGENLYAVMGVGPDHVPDAKAAVESWYTEIENYDFSTGESKTGGEIGHFVQIVWKSCRQLCMAYATGPMGEGDKHVSVIVAHYYTPKNVGNTMDNVQASSLKLMPWLCTLTTLASILLLASRI